MGTIYLSAGQATHDSNFSMSEVPNTRPADLVLAGSGDTATGCARRFFRRSRAFSFAATLPLRGPALRARPLRSLEGLTHTATGWCP